MEDKTGREAGEVLAFPGRSGTEGNPVLATDNEAYSDVIAERNRLRKDVRYLRQRIYDLERLADTDPLLPINNRRAFMREIRRAVSVADRYQTYSSLVYYDLDGLKRINDRFGHMVGDRVLLHVAETLTKGIRQSDMAARLGGDEFGVMLFQTGFDVANVKARGLARAVNQHDLRVEGHKLDVFLTWGICEIEPNMSADDVITKADSRMYDNKVKLVSGDDVGGE